MKKVVQILVSPNTATFEPDGVNPECVNFGHCYCPKCKEKSVAYGPAKGMGLVYAIGGCSHFMGAMAGHGYDILIGFEI